MFEECRNNKNVLDVTPSIWPVNLVHHNLRFSWFNISLFTKIAENLRLLRCLQILQQDGLEIWSVCPGSRGEPIHKQRKVSFQSVLHNEEEGNNSFSLQLFLKVNFLNNSILLPRWYLITWSYSLSCSGLSPILRTVILISVDGICFAKDRDAFSKGFLLLISVMISLNVSRTDHVFFPIDFKCFPKGVHPLVRFPLYLFLYSENINKDHMGHCWLNWTGVQTR